MSKPKDVLMDHDYDGIKELDNDLPPWWLYLFYFSIAFAVVYMLYFHVFHAGDLQIAKYEKEMHPEIAQMESKAPSHGLISNYHSPYYNPKGDVTPRIRKRFNSYIGPKIEFPDLVKEAMRRADVENLEKLKSAFPDLYQQLVSAGGPVTGREVPKPTAKAQAAPEAEVKELAPLTDEASLSQGKQIFAQNCVACHGKLGEGGIGPNLTDEYWLHGAGMNNIVHTIKVGVPAKGMISWRAVLNEDKIAKVASYIITLYGTNPPKAKKPQGEKVDMAKSK